MSAKASALIIILASGTAPAFASAALLAQAQPFDFFSSNRLVAFCLVGSGVGALISVSARMDEAEINSKGFLRKVLLKFVTSLLSGACVSPFILERYADKFGGNGVSIPTPAVTLAVSAVIASVAILTFNILAPLLARRGYRALQQYIPALSETAGDPTNGMHKKP